MSNMAGRGFLARVAPRDMGRAASLQDVVETGVVMVLRLAVVNECYRPNSQGIELQKVEEVRQGTSVSLRYILP